MEPFSRKSSDDMASMSPPKVKKTRVALAPPLGEQDFMHKITKTFRSAMDDVIENGAAGQKQELKAERISIAKRKAVIRRTLRNETRRVSRIKDKTKLLSTTDLVEAFKQRADKNNKKQTWPPAPHLSRGAVDAFSGPEGVSPPPPRYTERPFVSTAPLCT